MEDRKILALGVEIWSLVLVQDTLKQQASTSGQHCLVNSYIYMLLMPACFSSFSHNVSWLSLE